MRTESREEPATTRRSKSNRPPACATADPIGTLGPVALAAAAAITALLGGLLFLPPPEAPPLTLGARFTSFQPEWDTPLYVGAGVLSVVLLGAFCWLRGPASDRPTAVRRGRTQVGLAAFVVVTSVAVFLLARLPLIDGHDVAPAYGLFFALAFLLVGAAGVLGRDTPATPGVRSHDRTHDQDQKQEQEQEQEQELAQEPRARLSLVDVLAPVAIVATIFAPAWGRLAGMTYVHDQMLHWDYFAMGPAIAFSHGQALGTQVHTFYGFGWAMLFAALSPVLSLSYGHMIGVNVVITCMYLVGVYVFLRVFLHDRVWACTGVALAIISHFWARGTPAFSPYWGFPSLGILRWSFDVWVFIALIFFQRTGRMRWAVTAGAIVGLAVLFEIDTGLDLVLFSGFFWMCSMLNTANWRTVGRAGLTSAVVAGVTLFLGLALASRGTLLQAAFWSGWLENLRATSSGFSLFPITTTAGARVVAVFVLMATTYLVIVGRTLVLTVQRRADRIDVVLGALALYGYAVLTYFVGKSEPYNLMRASIPFVLVLAVLGQRATRYASSFRPTAAAAGRMVALAMAIAVLLTNPVFRRYEQRMALAGYLLGRAPSGGDICLLKQPRDICGLPPEYRDSQVVFQQIAERLRLMAPAGKTVAILDQTGPMFHLMSETTPWGQYSPLFFTLYSRARLDSVEDTFRRSPPNVAVIRDQPALADMDGEFQALLAQRFVLDDTIGGWELWRLKSPP